MALQLRDYQTKAIEKIREYFRTNRGFYNDKEHEYKYEARRRVVLQMATGSGKTATFAEMLKICHKRSKPALMVVKGAKLVHQASDRLTREGVDHGIWQANKTRDTHHPIQVCSIDTLYARKVTPDAEFIVIDEAHLTGGKSYQWLLTQEKYEKSFILGVSATPFSKKGLGLIGSDVIYPVTIRDLIAQGYLVGARYRVPHKPNLKGVKKTAGEYNAKDLERRLNEDGEKRALYGSLTKEWIEHCKGKRSILFGVSVAHAKALGEELEKIGARCAHIDGNTPHELRDEIISRLEANEIDVITSVGVLTTGVDIPSLECLLICRPTESYNLWIQMLGRGTRTFPGKENFLVIDMAGNTAKHGMIEAEQKGTVASTKATKSIESNLTTCHTCFAAFPVTQRIREGSEYLCPECGAVVSVIVTTAKGHEIEMAGGDLIELQAEPFELVLPQLIEVARENRYKKGWVLHEIKRLGFGEAAVEAAKPKVFGQKNWPDQHEKKNDFFGSGNWIEEWKMDRRKDLEELDVKSVYDFMVKDKELFDIMVQWDPVFLNQKIDEWDRAQTTQNLSTTLSSVLDDDPTVDFGKMQQVSPSPSQETQSGSV